MTLDDKITLGDVVLLAQYCDELVTFGATQEAAGDCNADGIVDNVDLVTLIEFELGL